MKPTHRLPTGLLCIAALTLSGCESYPDAAHPMSDGWRVAHVDHEVTANESTPLVRFTEDCRAVPIPIGRPEPARWALLHFRRPPVDVYRVVPLMGADRVEEGQEVYVNVDDCTQPVEPLRGKP
ncbi:MAG: hypothetical protein QM749_16105 [Aquabacterium sp.]